jgi:hypothetical protein
VQGNNNEYLKDGYYCLAGLAAKRLKITLAAWFFAGSTSSAGWYEENDQLFFATQR